MVTKTLTWSVIKRISFKIKPNSYSVDDLMHVWCVTASGIRVLPIGPILPSSPCLRNGSEDGGRCEWNMIIGVLVYHWSEISLWSCVKLLPINRAIKCRIVWQCSAWCHGTTVVPKIIVNVEHIGQQRLRGAATLDGQQSRKLEKLFSISTDHSMNNIPLFQLNIG